jgi:hypothetical protein
VQSFLLREKTKQSFLDGILSLKYSTRENYQAALNRFERFCNSTYSKRTGKDIIKELKSIPSEDRDEAYFVFVPFPTTNEVIRNRSNLLNIGVVVDVHDVPNARKTTQHTRTVRVAKSSLTPSVTIADPRIFEEAKSKSLKQWCDSLENRSFSNGFEHTIDKRREPLKLRNIYYLHISREHFRFEEFF